MKDSTMFIIFGAIVCVIAAIAVYCKEVGTAAPTPPPVIRYHCDDDVDTTKGAVKGVLTNCKPVVIERRM